MSYKERRQPASFRGVSFLVDAQTAEVGRRVQVNSYPFSDEVTTQDLGKKARKYTLTAYVIGGDHDLQRDRLIEALETQGVGELVHPDYGRQSVIAAVNQVNSDKKQRMTTFSLNFYHAADGQQSMQTQVNIAAVRNTAYQALDNALIERFAESLGITG